jgi:hypothetical protein
MKTKLWVGLGTGCMREVFRCPNTPTSNSHGHLYGAVIGPFRTLRGANFMAKYGANNPHCRNVFEAEKLAKRYVQ